MNVKLIDYTGQGVSPWHAAHLMIWTKRTRVDISPGGLEEIKSWPEEQVRKELDYMAATIPSSWEFCDFIFLITGVTRALTHQLVRARHASFAQQTMQILDLSAGWEYRTGPSLSGELKEDYEDIMAQIADTYKTLVKAGVKIEDARGVLPTNILTNVIMKVNLRTLCELVRKRTSPRNTGEFPDMLRLLKASVTDALPWSPIFLDRTADVVSGELFELIAKLPDSEVKTNILKRIDQLLTNV